jgi:hypothetical protein
MSRSAVLERVVPAITGMPFKITAPIGPPSKKTACKSAFRAITGRAVSRMDWPPAPCRA